MGVNLGNTAIADVKLGNTQIDKIYLGDTEIWSKSAPATIKALKFTSSGAQTLGIDNTKLGAISPNFEYSTDNGNTWITWDVSTTLAFGDGTDLYVRGSNAYLATPGGSYTGFVFSTNSSVSCSGNVMHLLDYTQDLTAFPGNSTYVFSHLFEGCEVLTSAPELPATTLTQNCYSEMFRGCTSLNAAPSLPATTMAISCYSFMFYNCTSLSLPPSLPATVMANTCYASMFRNCTSLIGLPTLPATNVFSNAYNRMFYGCSQIKLSETQTGEYVNQYVLGANLGSSSAPEMFGNTGGTFTGTPAQQTYYTSNTIVS